MRPVGPANEIDQETRTFSVSIAISAVRCTLTYLVLPFLLPLVGLSDAIGPIVGLLVGLVAIAANVWSIRRFWAADHRLKWLATVVSAGVVIMMTVLIVNDIRELAA